MLDLVRGYFTTSMALYPDEKRTWQELHHILLLQQMLEHFGRNAYYRFRRKEQLITPSEQKYIRQLFRKKGITDEPIYDEYVERYEW